MIIIKGFKLTNNGDISVSNNQIDMVEGNELLRQKVRQVLGTNKGEWFADVDEGINFRNILGKHKPQFESNNSALKALYDEQMSQINDNNSKLAEKLQNRLEGIE